MATTRRENSTRQPTKPRKTVVSTDQLAKQFASGLTISNTKGKQKAPAVVSDGALRISAMRSVNSASQALSTVIQSASGIAQPKPSSTLLSVTSAAASAAKHLAVLRTMRPNDMDVERAAMSVLTKLVTLEMYEDAMNSLEALHPQLCSLFNVAPPTSRSPLKLHLLSIPVPPSDSSFDAIPLTLGSNYLSYALTIFTHVVLTPSQDTKDASKKLDTFSQILTTTPSLLSWVPTLSSSLPVKQLDSALTRAYTTLTKACTGCKLHPSAIFQLRTYAATCLAHTSAGTVEPDHFWDQLCRIGGAFIRSRDCSEQEAMSAVLSAYSDLTNRVGERVDRATFMSGKGFIGYCEYWMAFAKKAGDICVLDRISSVMAGSSAASSSSDFGSGAPEEGVAGKNHKDSEGEQGVGLYKDTYGIEGARICATLLQMTVVLEQKGTDLVKRAQETMVLLKRRNCLVEILALPADADEQSQRVNGKVDRALERTRRAAISVLDSPSTSTQDDEQEIVRTLLETIVDTFDASLRQKPNGDVLTRCLDTLFVLSRTSLNPVDPRTFVPAHDYLTRATSLLEISVHNTANYTRCVSGAFHNLGATMYQAGRHGTAIGFLKDACALGVKALDTWKRESSVSGGGERKGENAEEGWRQLEEQLYRRWELLGVCYSKIGDRRHAFEAFMECIKTFPYSKSGFIERTEDMNLQALFDTSAATKQLAAMVDRVTSLGVCELLLDVTSVSLRSLDIDDACITGALLERQIDSLEGSRWKDGVRIAVVQLLVDVLGIYGPDMPIRRARALLKCMEFAYHTGPEAIAGIGTPEDIGSEVEKLLLAQNFHQDMGLALFCTQYQASVHLWLALHAHRRVDTEQSAMIAHHSEQACRILKSVILTEPKATRKSSPKQIIAAKKSVLRPPTKQRPTRKTISRDPVTPKPTSRRALQPMSLNVITPPRQNDVVKPLLVFDDPENLISLFQLTARISGLLALTLPKVHILDVVRKLCEQQLGIQSDGYILASIDLAHEYVKLGKTKRAASIFNQTLNTVKGGKVSDEACAFFYLRFAESLAMVEDVARSSSIYCEALALSDRFDFEDKGLPSLQRVQTRVKRLEKAAMASHVFALIQYSIDEVPTAFDGLLQSLRLWNRAVDTLTRLNPHTPLPSASADDANPFQMASLKEALPTETPNTPPKEQPPLKKTFPRRPSMDGLEWRVSEGLLVTLFSLSQAYLNRGSAREAEYFAQQAQDLAESLNTPTMVSRALAKKGEVQLYQGHLEASYESLMKASELLQNIPGIEGVDVRRLRGVYHERTARAVNASELYEETIVMIEELDQVFKNFDGLALSRKSIGASPNAKSTKEVILPELFAAVLRQRIWLLRDNNVEDYTASLDKFLSLPHSSRTKAEENLLMAKLTLHAAYGRFRADMFLSSLTESTIALPMGMSTKNELALPPHTQDILGTLDSAETLFWANLTIIARRGNVPDVRDSYMSLALIRAFQTSLGRSGASGPALAVGLLDASAAITLRREMLEAIQHKFPPRLTDDLHWPILNSEGVSAPRSQPKISRHLSYDDALDEEDGSTLGESPLTAYWNAIQARYQSRILDPASLSVSQMIGLPSNWTVVHISVTEDKSTLFIARQEGGETCRSPLIFCVPLKGRRDNGSGEEEEEHLTFENALDELKDIVRLSDEGTKSAIHIKADDREARSTWWKTRMELDTRLRELLENIEFCWLGAFKTILSPRQNLTPDMIHGLRAQFEKIFLRSLRVQDKKTKQRTSAHRKTTSQGQSQFPSQVTFDDAILECFSTLSPKCRDEELEDLVYFILDLYQFHGVPVAIAEVDIVQVVVDLRALLEDHAMKLSRRKVRREDPASDFSDEHTFLVLDRNLQGIPWESIPILRGRSVSRIPSVDFLHDRILYAKCKRDSMSESGPPTKSYTAVVDPHMGYYILNPSGDLSQTENRFKDWATEMEQVGWQGITGCAPSEQQFLDALQNKDLVVYFGHGGGEQYLRSHKIRNLRTCAATMLWGCSSGALREMGDFDRMGTPYNYMLAGCPSLVANLWDVTDKDIDKFSQSVFDKLRLTASGIKQWSARQGDMPISVVNAVAQSRDACKLKYLTGAAPVVYGIPFYL